MFVVYYVLSILKSLCLFCWYTCFYLVDSVREIPFGELRSGETPFGNSIRGNKFPAAGRLGFVMYYVLSILKSLCLFCRYTCFYLVDSVLGNSVREIPFGETPFGKQIPSRRAAGVCDVLRPIYFKIFMSVLPIHLSPFRELRSGETNSQLQGSWGL